MPIIEGNTRVPLTIKNVVSCLNKIKCFLGSGLFKSLNEALAIDVEDLNRRIDGTICYLKEKEGNRVVVIESCNPVELCKEWEQFNGIYSNRSHILRNSQYERLIARTKKVIKFLDECNDGNRVRSNFANVVRNKNQQEEEERLSDLSKKRSELRQKYELALVEKPKNEDKIRQLEKRLEELGDAVVQSKRTIGNIKIDSAEEQRMRERIDMAFDELKDVNNLDCELTKLKREYYVMLVAIVGTVVMFFIFYGSFIYNLPLLHITTWHAYLPYTMSVPITIALLCLFVYLKNRASKISIEISAQLYDIHYLEGLLKLINSISRTSDEALDNIERIVVTMVNSFLEKTKRKNLEEKKLAKMERQELEDTPYWKMMLELKDIIKTIKK